MAPPVAYLCGLAAALGTLTLAPMALSLALRAVGGLSPAAAAERPGAELWRHLRFALLASLGVLLPAALALDALAISRTGYRGVALALAVAAALRAELAARGGEWPWRLVWSLLEGLLVGWAFLGFVAVTAIVRSFARLVL